MQKWCANNGELNDTLRLCKDTQEDDVDEEEHDIDMQTVFKLNFLVDAHKTNYPQAEAMRLTTHLLLAVLR